MAVDDLERLRLDWQVRIALALAEAGARTPRCTNQLVRTPFEQLASAAVEEIWPEVERLLRPVLDVADQLEAARPAVPGRVSIDGRAGVADAVEAATNPWMDADEAASMLDVTPHTLRRMARDGRCPVVVRRIGGRWRFARSDVVRFVSGEPSTSASLPIRG